MNVREKLQPFGARAHDHGERRYVGPRRRFVEPGSEPLGQRDVVGPVDNDTVDQSFRSEQSRQRRPRCLRKRRGADLSSLAEGDLAVGERAEPRRRAAVEARIPH